MRFAQLQYILLLLIVSINSSYGQQKDILSNTLITPKEYYLQVKQFGEFIDRFNYKSDWRGNLITDEFKKAVPRANYILYLFNGEDSRMTNPTDSSYRVVCSQFIAYINASDKPQVINLFSGQVKALVKVNILYYGKEQSASLEMLPEVLPDRSAKWVINRVEADWLTLNADSLLNRFISPNSHETNFINLKKLNATSNPIYYFATPTATTMNFISEVTKKHIVIQHTEKVTYFITFPGWEITVDEFNRTSNNSGWLISNLKKCN